MATGQSTPAGDGGARTPSSRVRLAELAAEAAGAVPGVAGLDSGAAGLFATVGGATRIGGVTCASAPEGGFDVSLRLVCELTELTAVADAVRAAVQRAGAGAGIDVQTVTITVADVLDPEDPGAPDTPAAGTGAGARR